VELRGAALAAPWGGTRGEQPHIPAPVGAAELPARLGFHPGGERLIARWFHVEALPALRTAWLGQACQIVFAVRALSRFPSLSSSLLGFELTHKPLVSQSMARGDGNEEEHGQPDKTCVVPYFKPPFHVAPCMTDYRQKPEDSERSRCCSDREFDGAHRGIQTPMLHPLIIQAGGL
jgi:hypothetical protein